MFVVSLATPPPSFYEAMAMGLPPYIAPTPPEECVMLRNARLSQQSRLSAESSVTGEFKFILRQIGYVNTGVALSFIGYCQLCLYNDRILIGSSLLGQIVLQARWSILENNEKATLSVNTSFSCFLRHLWLR